MTSSNFWWQSGAGGGGYQIGNSLRFRGAQYLTWTPSVSAQGRVFTHSVWVKKSNLGQYQTLITAYNNSNADDTIRFNSDDTLLTFFNDTGDGSGQSTPKYRDPSAWYHIVTAINISTQTIKYYVNGVEVPMLSLSIPSGQYVSNFNSAGKQNAIGRRLAANNYYFTGYMAEVHWVPGQFLGPETFGEFNSQGVWVPKVVDLEVSPNVPENDAKWSSYGTGADTTTYTWKKAFNGVLTGLGSGAKPPYGNGNSCSWTTTNPVPFTTLRLHYSRQVNSNGTIVVNGVTLTKDNALGVTGDGSVDITSMVTSPLTSIVINEFHADNSNNGLSLTGIEVDGVVMLDGDTGYDENGWYLDFSDPDNIGKDRSGNGNDWTPTGFELADPSSSNFDWMEDHPAKNYSTLNPLWNGINITYSEANLRVRGGNSHSPGSGSIAFNGGRFYMEATAVADTTNKWSCGVLDTDIAYRKQDSLTNYIPGYQPGNVYGEGDAICLYNNDIYKNGAVSQSAPLGAAVAAGDVVQMLIDADAGTIQFGINDTFSPTETFDPSKSYIPHFTTEECTWDVNFGQRPFAYPPGFSSPTTAFNTLVYTGTNNGSTAPQPKTGVGFSPDLVWIKNRDSGTYNHLLFDSVRGVGESLSSNNTSAENFQSTAGYLSSFDADGFSLSKGTQAGSAGSQNVDALGVNYVAWCFNAGDSAPVTNNDGTITSTVKASPENGFSVVTYTGDGNTSATVGHGLNKTPTMIIVKKRINPSATGANWVVYHQSMGTGNAMFLNSVSPASAGYWNTAPGSSEFQPSGGGSETNYSGDSYVAYCFADTDGKVKTGSYVGNGSSSTGYQSVGFQPTMIMVKCSSAASDWNMYTKEIGGGKSLAANLANAEQSPGASGVTFHNDGFEIGANDNSNGQTYIYIAFAENFTPDDVKDLTAKNLEPVAITDPSDHFQTILDTGANILTSAQTAFPNGLWWIKDRENSNNHQLVDSVRGGSLTLKSNLTAAESSYLAPSGSSVAWCWKAGDSNVVNNEGSLQSTVSANQAAGFSIVTYTAGANGAETVGHGLLQAPEFIIFKDRSNATNWPVFHTGINTSTDQRLQLNTPNAVGSVTNIWGLALPDSSVFGVLTGTISATGAGCVAYCWHSVPGYSSFGIVEGNSLADGPFCYTGMRPAFVLWKSVSSERWAIWDASRMPYNTANSPTLFPDRADVESTATGYAVDFLSNGFKIRGASVNGAADHVWAAFAEHPFGGSNVSPATAR